MTHALDLIEDGVLHDEPVAALLRKVVVLGGQVGSDSLRSWARRELHGYNDGAPVPEYRQLQAGLQVDASMGRSWVKGQSIQPWEAAAALKAAGLEYEVTSTVPCSQPIAELQALADKTDSIRMTPGWWSVAAKQLDKGQPFQQTTAIYYLISPQALAGVVDRVKTQLADLVAELRITSPREASPTREQVDRAYQIVINGDVATVLQGQANAVQQTLTVIRGDWESLRTALADNGISDEDLQVLRQAIEEDVDPTAEDSKVRMWISRVGSAGGRFIGAAGAGGAGNVISELVGQYYGWS